MCRIYLYSMAVVYAFCLFLVMFSLRRFIPLFGLGPGRAWNLTDSLVIRADELEFVEKREKKSKDQIVEIFSLRHHVRPWDQTASQGRIPQRHHFQDWVCVHSQDKSDSLPGFASIVSRERTRVTLPCGCCRCRDRSIVCITSQSCSGQELQKMMVVYPSILLDCRFQSVSFAWPMIRSDAQAAQAVQAAPSYKWP